MPDASCLCQTDNLTFMADWRRPFRLIQGAAKEDFRLSSAILAPGYRPNFEGPPDKGRIYHWIFGHDPVLLGAWGPDHGR